MELLVRVVPMPPSVTVACGATALNLYHTSSSGLPAQAAGTDADADAPKTLPSAVEPGTSVCAIEQSSFAVTHMLKPHCVGFDVGVPVV